MRTIQILFIVLAGGLPCMAHSAALVPDEPIKCSYCEEWNEPQQPFRVHGDTYYVGTAGLAAILIADEQGLILIDGALPQSAPLIAGNIRQLGFQVEDIHVILNSHAHFDHAGGINALQRASQAVVRASEPSAQALRQGKLQADDPQHGFGSGGNFPAVSNVQLIADRETIKLGNTSLKLYLTPGHTPGGSTWTWQSCERGECLDIVYADSLSAVSADDYRFGQAGAATIRQSAQLIRELPCDILLSPHPFLFEMKTKMTAQIGNPFVETDACAKYADRFDAWVDRRLKEEENSLIN